MDADQHSDSALQPPAPDSFATVAALLQLIADPTACAGRLRDLERALSAAGKAQAKLAAERAAHEESVSRALAEIETQQKALRAKEIKLFSAEGMLNHRTKILEQQRADLDRRTGRFQRFGIGTVVQENPTDGLLG